MPDFSFPYEHEKHKKGHKRGGEQSCIEGTEPLKQRVAYRMRFRHGDHTRLARFARRRKFVDSQFQQIHATLNATGDGAQWGAIYQPVSTKLVHAADERRTEKK